jgi:two-component system response regulator CpxR
MQTRILIIDDDVGLCGLVRDYFAGSELQIEGAHDGATGLYKAVEGRYDLVLLDVMLPVLDGFEVLRQLRRRSSVPVIMLTARGEQSDRVAGLNEGADDYIPKPFGPQELEARIAAVLRRTRPTAGGSSSEVIVGDLRLRTATRSAWVRNQPIEITATEFDILDLLARASGRVVTRDEVCGILYQRPATPFERALEVHISRLRKKTENAGMVIRSIRGSGYLLAEEDHK